MTYFVYHPDGRKHCVRNNIENAVSACGHIGGYVLDDRGALMHGKRQVETIDITPTWVSILPVLILALTDGTPTGKKLAREELVRMAEIADRAKS